MLSENEGYSEVLAFIFTCSQKSQVTFFRKLQQERAANIIQDYFPSREGSLESNASPLEDFIWRTKAALSAVSSR